MHKPEPHEMRCLSAIAKGAHEEAGTCSAAVLAQLMAKGLISSSPKLRLPLEWTHLTYSLTEAGKMALRAHGE